VATAVTAVVTGQIGRQCLRVVLEHREHADQIGFARRGRQTAGDRFASVGRHGTGGRGDERVDIEGDRTGGARGQVAI